MPVLSVGSTEIPYSIRYSDRAKRMSIRVTPDRVEAVAPVRTSEEKVTAFVLKKRQWVYNKVEDITSVKMKLRFSWPDRFVTGAKIHFRGRSMKLRVTESDIPEIRVRYKSAFIVEKPNGTLDSEVKRALENWLSFRLKNDVMDLVNKHAPRLQVKPGHIRISDYKTRWGSCSKIGNININWLLILAPRPVLEYVVVHELCHLRYRNHSSEFWNLVAETLPDFPARKRWLTENGRLMSL